MVLTANEQLLDIFVQHQIQLLRAGHLIADETVAELAKTEVEIERLINTKVRSAPMDRKKLAALLALILSIRAEAWHLIEANWKKQFFQIMSNEADFMVTAIGAASPVVLDTKRVGYNRTKEILRNRTAMGNTLLGWIQQTQQIDLSQISQSVVIGIQEQRTNKPFIPPANNTRRNIEAIVLSMLMALISGMREEFAKEHDFINWEFWASVLDNRTTPICRSLDGKIFRVGVGPYPPIHWRCRSLRLTLLDPDFLGTRPAKPYTEKQLLREFAAQKKLSGISTREDLPRGYKGEYDLFREARIREMVGRVPARLTWQDWLERQPAWYQDEVLGPTRGKLFRKGSITLDRFVDRRYRLRTLSDLAKMDRSAFLRAGLNPDDY